MISEINQSINQIREQRTNQSPDHLIQELSPMAIMFYNLMKIRDEKKQHIITTSSIDDITEPESELGCVPIEVDICAICYESDKLSNLFNSRCGHNFHKNCLERWCEHNDTCPNCREPKPFGYSKASIRTSNQVNNNNYYNNNYNNNYYNNLYYNNNNNNLYYNNNPYYNNNL